ncbi:MAG: class I SAM-dependent methyltransferase [Deltaproteobacteria bacterium]|nr:class I SAM-dependent methyltransferase [Deltaproteobacteria bacterium]
MADVLDTARAIARCRAAESARPAGERLFEDPLARLFAGDGDAGAEDAVAAFARVPFFAEQVRLRTRYLDDLVRAEIARGARDVVVLGAGFDTRALRLAEIARHGVRVHEIDFPEQHARRRATLDQAGVALPSYLRFLDCDLSHPDALANLTGPLADGACRPGSGAVFLLEGVISYIEDDAVERTFRFVADAGGPGSRIGFNYTASRFNRRSLASLLEAGGLNPVEDLDLAAVHRRYLPGEPPPGGDLFGIATAERR